MAWSLRFLLSLHHAVTKSKDSIESSKPTHISSGRRHSRKKVPITADRCNQKLSHQQQQLNSSSHPQHDNNNIGHQINTSNGSKQASSDLHVSSNGEVKAGTATCCPLLTPSYPSFVKIVEVGPRDGLQAEKQILSTGVKVSFINYLSETGLSVIETTSFVNPRLVPQLGDNSLVYENIRKHKNVSYPVLVPNLIGLRAALKAAVKEIAVFTTPSDAFSLRNVNCTSARSLEICRDVVAEARRAGLRVRGYISCALGCPYQGDISPDKVADFARQVYEFGCYEISLGDTIGIGTPASMRRLLEEVLKYVPVHAIAVHCHDTYGQALPNILTALEYGISVVDSSVSGLGGCPFAEGATGNVPTEDVVYMLHGMGIETGVDLDRLIIAGEFICKELSKETASKAGKAVVARRKLAERRASLWQGPVGRPPFRKMTSTSINQTEKFDDAIREPVTTAIGLTSVYCSSSNATSNHATLTKASSTASKDVTRVVGQAQVTGTSDMIVRTAAS